MISLLLQKQSDLGLSCLSMPFWQVTSVQNFRTGLGLSCLSRPIWQVTSIQNFKTFTLQFIIHSDIMSPIKRKGRNVGFGCWCQHD